MSNLSEDFILETSIFPFVTCVYYWIINNFNIYLPEGKRKSKSDGSESSDDCMSKKDLALQQALDQITSSFGKESIMWLGPSANTRHVPVVSTGSFALDMALGTSGLPKVSVLF